MSWPREACKIIEKFKEDLRNISIAEMADLAALLNKKVKNRLPIKVAIVTDSPEHLYDALVLLEQDINQAPVEEGQIRRINVKDTSTRIIIISFSLGQATFLQVEYSSSKTGLGSHNL